MYVHLFARTHTDNVQGILQGHFGLRVDLALVLARVTHLRIFDLECPVDGAGRMYHLEALVGRVGGRAGGQDMQILFPYP